MLVSTETLAAHLQDPTWVIFDCRHDLSDFAKGFRQYSEGHVPGAHFVPAETVLSGAKTGGNGRHPLPLPEEWTAFLGQHGVDESKTIVVYDDVGGQYAARLWWMARWIGLARVHILDGGFPKWLSEKRPLTTTVPTPAAKRLALRLEEGSTWSTEDVLKRMGDSDSLLIDARTPERYRGETEPIDRVAGRIPGAINRFFKQNLNSDLTFREPAELKREYDALLSGRRADQVGHQCGSGVTACVNLFAMEYAGLRGSKLYVGSWSEWISDPARPIARG